MATVIVLWLLMSLGPCRPQTDQAFQLFQSSATAWDCFLVAMDGLQPMISQLPYQALGTAL